MQLARVVALSTLLATPAFAQFGYPLYFRPETVQEKQARYDKIAQYDVERLKDVDRRPKDVFVYMYVDQALKDFPEDRVREELTCYYAQQGIYLHQLREMPDALDKEIILLEFLSSSKYSEVTGIPEYGSFFFSFMSSNLGVSDPDQRKAYVRVFPEENDFVRWYDTAEHEIGHLFSLPHAGSIQHSGVDQDFEGVLNLMCTKKDRSDGLLLQTQIDQIHSYLSGGQVYDLMESGFENFVKNMRDAIELRFELGENFCPKE